MSIQLFNMINSQYTKKTLTGMSNVEWSDGAHCYLPSLKFYGESYQYDTPTPEAPISVYTNMITYNLPTLNRYIIPPYLQSIGEYRDEWDYVTGKGIHRIKEIVLDGETTKCTFDTNHNLQFKTLESIAKSGNSCVLCTHFDAKWNTNNGSIYANVINGETILMLWCDAFTSEETGNAWLKAQYDAGNPVKIYYVLAEPQPFEERPEPYQPIPNDSGGIFVDMGGYSDIPIEITYIAHP